MKARLVLHFDINKTILMTDRAQGANAAHMINVLLCECAWGRLEPGPAWVPVGRLATDRYTRHHTTLLGSIKTRECCHMHSHHRVMLARQVHGRVTDPDEVLGRHSCERPGRCRLQKRGAAFTTLSMLEESLVAM